MSPTLETSVRRIAAEEGLSGVVRVDIGDEIAFESAFGLRHRALGVPNTVDTQFATASGTKGLTALTVMSLVASGELALGTTARSLLGRDLPMLDDRVTVEHLLAHRSGIWDYFDEDVVDDNEAYVLAVSAHELVTTEDYLRILGGQPAKFDPDERFSYCNGGYVVLALLAERAAGAAFHDLVEERVCQPAGMTATAFLRADALPERAALGYLDDGVRSNVFHLPVRGNGDGGAYTTVADIHRLWRALERGAIVPDEIVAEMTRPRSELAADSMWYGLGFWLDPSRGVVSLHGFDAGVGFVTARDRVRSVTYTVIANQTRGAWPCHQRLAALLTP